MSTHVWNNNYKGNREWTCLKCGLVSPAYEKIDYSAVCCEDHFLREAREEIEEFLKENFQWQQQN